MATHEHRSPHPGRAAHPWHGRGRVAASRDAATRPPSLPDPGPAVDAAVDADPLLEDARAVERSLRGVVAALQRSLDDVDPALTPVQLWCLRRLDEAGSATVKDLAEAIGVVPSTVSRNADRLVAEGLISRRTGRGDRRLVDLRLTRAGTMVLAEVSEARARTIHGTVVVMDDDDRAALLRGAAAFAAAMAAPGGPEEDR